MIIKGVYTPYETKLLPILNKVIENTTGEVIKSANGVDLKPLLSMLVSNLSVPSNIS